MNLENDTTQDAEVEEYYNILGNIEVERKDGRYVVERHGISAKAIEIEGVPVAFDESMSIDADKVVHMPNEYKAGCMSFQFDD